MTSCSSMSRPAAKSATFCGSSAAWPSGSSGMPTSPPETTSLARPPDDAPSCAAKIVPHTLRSTRPASGIAPAISPGSCSVKTCVSDSAIRVATGSASWLQNGIVARIHWVRVSAFGWSGSALKPLDSSSQSPATVKARSTPAACASVGVVDPAPAAETAWSVAIDQSTVPSAFCTASRSRPISCSRPAAPPGSPIAFASSAASGLPPCSSIRRRISWRSGSGPSSGVSAMHVR